MNIQKELDRIADALPYLDDVMTWEAFVSDGILEVVLGEQDRYLPFAREAAKAVRGIRYDVPYGDVIQSVTETYADLLEKYGFPEDILPYLMYSMFRTFLNGRVAVFMQTTRSEGTREIPEMPEGDIDNAEMATVLANLPPQAEVGNALKELGIDYDYEHLHTVTWFASQMTHGDTPGYTRSAHNFSARTTYNRLLDPYTLLWIAASLGEDLDLIRKLAAEAELAKTYAEKCGIVRRAVPFSRIYELALQTEAQEAAEEEDEE